MKAQNLIPICEEALGRLLCHIKGETSDTIPSFNESLKEFRNLKAKMSLVHICAAAKLEQKDLNRFENTIGEVNRQISRKSDTDNYTNRNTLITQLRFLVFMEQINSRIPYIALIPSVSFPISKEKEIVGLKKIRAVELTIRALINEKYESQEKLTARIHSLTQNSDVVERIKKSADYNNVLTGTTFSQLIGLFVHTEEFRLYREYFEGSPYLTYLKTKHASIRNFLDEIRKIRNLFAHNKLVSDTRIFLLDVYYDEISIPLCKAFGHGKTKVNPETFLDVSKEELTDFFASLRGDIQSVRNEVRDDLRLAKLDIEGRIFSSTNDILKSILSIKDDIHTFKDNIRENIEEIIRRNMTKLAQTKLGPGETTDRRNKLILARRVYENWIHRVLESFQGDWLEIPKEQKDSLIARPMGGLPRDMPLPRNTNITDIFGDAIGALLIVGDPGVGKTFLALELARSLLVRALNDSSQPIPVILNLSTWNNKRLRIADWLIRQISSLSQYNIPKAVCSKWIADSQNAHLMYVLDGLDEVDPKRQKSCLVELHKFREEHGLSRIVVTSRYKEYLDIGIPFKADKAILLNGLSQRQFENHLPEGLSVDSLKSMITNDELRPLGNPLNKRENSRKPVKIFLSYIRDDIEIAEKIYNDLEKSGLKPWMDVKDLRPGQNWRMIIEKEIKSSEFFLALLSQKALSKRGYVQKELKIALGILDEFPSDEVFVIPVRIDNCSPSDPKIADLHFADLFPSYEKGLRSIMRTVHEKHVQSEPAVRY